MPVRRRKYLEKNEGLAKCISSAICAADLSVCNDIKRITNLNNLRFKARKSDKAIKSFRNKKKIATFAMFRHQGAYIFVEDR